MRISDEEKGLARYFVRGLLGTGGLKIAQAFAGLVTGVLMARALGSEGYGIYAFAFSIASLLAIPSQMGLPALLVREVARFQFTEEWGLLKGLLRRSHQLVFLNGIILLVLGIGYYLFTRFEQELNDQWLTLVWAIVLVPLVALGNITGATLRGLRKVVLGQMPEMFLRPMFLMFFILIFWTLWDEISPSSTMLLHCLAAFFSFLIGALLLKNSLPCILSGAIPTYDTRAWLKSLLPLALVSGFQVVNMQADILILGLTSSKADVGLYRVIAQSAGMVTVVLASINIVIAPQIARLHTAGNKVLLQRMVTLSSRLILVVATPLALILIFQGQEFLALVFGEEFSGGWTGLSILSAAQLINAAMGSVAFLLNMTGHEKDTARGVMIAATLNVILNLLLIPRFGIEGAAMATLVSSVLWNVLLYRAVKLRLGINSLAF